MVRSLSALSPLFRCLSVVLLSCLALALPAQAIPGATDKVPAASLLVPFFETGIDSVVNPHDTLLVVSNHSGGTGTFHYHVWNIDGSPTSIQGNVTLLSAASWSVAMRDIITPASVTAKNLLSEGPFYRGFVTIDGVSVDTTLNPKSASFPFAAANRFGGYIYYTRLSQGSAVGINMIHLESVPASVNTLLRDFYAGGIREEIDSDARVCAHQLATGVACIGDADPINIERIYTRTFGSAPLNGSTRVVLFTWDTGVANGTGGPSVICAPAGGCGTEYPVHFYNEAGTDLIAPGSTIELNHVVNVIEFDGEVPGFFSVWNVPDPNSRLQVFGLSFNTANAGSALNWDSSFEAVVVP